MAQDVNVHELAALPYAGMANDALKKSGNWDELGGAQPKKYRVSVTYKIEETETVTIEARSEDEAEEAAIKKVEEDSFEEIDVLYVEVEQ